MGEGEGSTERRGAESGERKARGKLAPGKENARKVWPAAWLQVELEGSGRKDTPVKSNQNSLWVEVLDAQWPAGIDRQWRVQLLWNISTVAVRNKIRMWVREVEYNRKERRIELEQYEGLTEAAMGRERKGRSGFGYKVFMAGGTVEVAVPGLSGTKGNHLRREKMGDILEEYLQLREWEDAQGVSRWSSTEGGIREASMTQRGHHWAQR
ncbi:hypothetical protein EV426DRAFT_709387 [Tirmania nivea]|nr:hypothetical protein EV426DRAFT_709387 [Tirmania nivea]